MSIWTDATISRFAQEAENRIADTVRCITKRVSIAITATTPNYTLPADVMDIRRVTWMGKKMEPLGAKEFEEFRITNPNFTFGSFNPLTFSTAFFIDSGVAGLPRGTPYAYFFSSFGENVIRLHPIPSQGLAFNSGDLYKGNIIAVSFIVEYWAYPDFTSTTQRIPAWVRRRLVKNYVMSRLMAQEGPGYDPEGSKFFSKMFDDQLERFKSMNNSIFIAKPQNLGDSQSKFVLPRPTLKYKYLGF